MKTSKFKNVTSKDVLEEIIYENLDNYFKELEKLNKLNEIDIELKEAKKSKKKER